MLKITLATLLALSLVACGGSEELNATTPAQFNSPDDVAGLISAFNGTAGSFGIALSDTGAKSASAGKSKNAMPIAKSTRGAVRAKATTVESCDSGSLTFTDDTSTLYSDDGLSVASNCRFSDTQSSTTTSTTLNGKISEKCVDSGQSESNCNASTLRIADGASGGTTFDLGVVSSGGGSNVNLALRLKGDLLESTSGDTDNISLNAALTYSDSSSRISGTALFENFSNAYTANANSGGGSETLNGNFGITSSRSQCALGKVSIKTDSLIITDSNDEPIGGQLTLTDGRGQQARVSFSSDGSTTVTLSNGQTRRYGAVQLASLCQ